MRPHNWREPILCSAYTRGLVRAKYVVNGHSMRSTVRQGKYAIGSFRMDTLGAAEYQPSPIPTGPGSGWFDWPYARRRPVPNRGAGGLGVICDWYRACRGPDRDLPGACRVRPNLR